MSTPLEKPAHLAPHLDNGPWLAKRRFAALALGLGVVSFIVVAIAHPAVSSLPDPRLSLPGLGLSLAAAVASLVQREPRGYWLWALGLGVAGAAVVLGWFLMIGVVIGATAIVILILHAVM